MYLVGNYMKSKFDYTGECKKRGNRGESRFALAASSNGYSCKKVVGGNDRKLHIDYYLTDQNGNQKTVDVKAKKKISRTTDVQTEWVWVEFKTVDGRDGWLYGGADLIAFEQDKGFLVVDRSSLAELAEDKVDKEKLVNKATDAYYSVYTRKGRKDEISLINIEDIISIEHEIWERDNSNMSFKDQFRDLDIDLHGVRLPEIQIPSQEYRKNDADPSDSNVEFLKRLCTKGFNDKITKGKIDPDLSKEYGDRINSEISVLEDTGLLTIYYWYGMLSTFVREMISQLALGVVARLAR